MIRDKGVIAGNLFMESPGRPSVALIYSELQSLRDKLEEEKHRNAELLKSEKWAEMEASRLKDLCKKLEQENDMLKRIPSTPQSLPASKACPPALPNSGKATAPPLLNVGKAKAPPPFVPKAAPVLKTETVERPTTNDFINLHWKPASGLVPVTLTSDPIHALSDNDAFLKPLQAFADGFTPDDDFKQLPISSHKTIFTTPSPSPSLEPAIRKYFSRRQARVEVATSISASKRSALDAEKQKLVGLALGGTLGAKGSRKASFRQYREAIIACDTTLLPPSVLCPLLQLLRSVTDDELRAVAAAVPSDDDHLLEDLAECDAFLYHMSQVPDVRIRLECLIFETSFDELYASAIENLNAISVGLKVIYDRLPYLTDFFKILLYVGNTLNHGSKAPQLLNFQLATLLRLSEVKSSLNAKMDLLHFSLAAGNLQIFSDADAAILRRACAARTHRVRDEIKDLLDAVAAVKEASALGGIFGKRMSTFRAAVNDKVGKLSANSLFVFASYKNLANFLEDAKAVYPPPREKTIDQFDLFECLAAAAVTFKNHERELSKLKIDFEHVEVVKSEHVECAVVREVIKEPEVVTAVLPEVELSAPCAAASATHYAPQEESNSPDMTEKSEEENELIFGENISMQTPPGGFRDIKNDFVRVHRRSSSLRFSRDDASIARTSWYTAQRFHIFFSVLRCSERRSSNLSGLHTGKCLLECAFFQIRYIGKASLAIL